MKFLRRSIVGLFLLSMTFALLALAGQSIVAAVQERMNEEPRSFPARERVLAVNVLPYEPTTVTPVLQVFGDLRSQRTLDIRASVGGNVIEVSEEFVEGGRVEAGQLLVRIDPTDAEAALARSRADLQDAEAELRDAERAIVLARDELTAAEDQVTLRERALERQLDLSDRGVSTAAALEDAELAVSSARATVLTRRQAVATAEARIDQATTRLLRTRIDIAETERALADTEITAAFSGVLSEVSVGEGGRVAANELLARLIDPDLLEVAFRVSTSQYTRLLDEDGDLRPSPVTATLDVSGVDLTAAGRLSRVSAAVPEGQTGRLIFARLDEAAGFRPGDFVTVGVEEPPLDNVAQLPATAVAADGTILVVGEEDRLDVGNVEILRRQGDAVIVRGEDLSGRLVVAERSPLLGSGIKVRPLLPGGETATPEASETVQLDPDRRARLVAFVQGSPMPDEAKTRILSQLEGDEVPAEVVARLESRMGS